MADGLPIRAQVAPRPVGLLVGLQSSYHPLLAFPAYADMAALPVGEQARALRDPAFRARLLADMEATDDAAGAAGTTGAGAARSTTGACTRWATCPTTSPRPRPAWRGWPRRGRSIPAELLLDLLAENDGRNFLYTPFSNYAEGNLDACGEMLAHPLTIFGLGDGGAHVGLISDASFPTYALSHWARDRAHGRMEVGRVVEQLTSATAGAVGLHDRGVLAPGMRADINVIDFDRLACAPPVMAYDLPAGGKRLLQGARGYRATVVAGAVTYRDGEPTGALPGRLVRGGRAPGPDAVKSAHEAGTLHELEPAAEWRAGDIADADAWTLRLSAADHAELDAALAVAKRKSTDPLELDRDDFPLDAPGGQARRGRATPCSTGGASPASPRSTPRATTMTTSRSSTGASACTSASPGPRTSTATCWATSPTRARRSTTRRCAATSSAASRSTTTPTGPTWSACSACARPAPAASPAWPTRWRSTTTWCASARTWPRRSTSRCPTTPGASRPPARRPSTRCRPSPSTPGGSSSASSPSTSSPRSAIPTRPGSARRHARPLPPRPRWPTTRTSTCTWTCSRARCSSSTTTTCSTAAPPTRTTWRTATSGTSSACGWPPTR